MKTFTEVLEQIHDSYASQLKSLSLFREQFPDMPQTCQSIEDLANDPDFPEGVRISAFWGYQWGGSLSVSILDLNAFKEPILCKLLEDLSAKYNAEFTSGDSPAYSMRTFRAVSRWEKGMLDIVVEACVKDNATGCKRIQVGVKTDIIETPIYQLDCQGEEHGE